MGKLEDMYIVPPFSVLDTKQGYWQKRKRMWLDFGIKSEEGRKDDLTYGEGLGVVKGDGEESKTSIFDPVLCELSYKWFCPKNGKIFDNFAGGSVRGIIAAKLGYKYTGIDLNEQQLISNRQQAEELVPNNPPTWICGDSRKSLELDSDNDYDLIFTCPPYYDLEVYSKDPNDMSSVNTYEEFIKMYGESMRCAISKLKNNRFMIYTVTNIRDKRGFYRDFVSDTIRLAKENGLHFYNDIILLNCVGSLSMRVNKQFSTYRKVGKQHQNVLVFYKGDDFHNIDRDFEDVSIENINQKTMSSFFQ